MYLILITMPILIQALAYGGQLHNLQAQSVFSYNSGGQSFHLWYFFILLFRLLLSVEGRRELETQERGFCRDSVPEQGEHLVQEAGEF